MTFSLNVATAHLIGRTITRRQYLGTITIICIRSFLTILSLASDVPTLCFDITNWKYFEYC